MSEMQLIPRMRLMKASRSPSNRSTILLAALIFPLAQSAFAQDATGIKAANLKGADLRLCPDCQR